MTSPYPEHEKLTAISDQSQAIGDFLEWLSATHDIRLCHRPMLDEVNDQTDFYYPYSANIVPLLAEFFDINENKLEEEKRAMIKEMAKLNKDH